MNKFSLEAVIICFLNQISVLHLISIARKIYYVLLMKSNMKMEKCVMARMD